MSAVSVLVVADFKHLGPAFGNPGAVLHARRTGGPVADLEGPAEALVHEGTFKDKDLFPEVMGQRAVGGRVRAWLELEDPGYRVIRVIAGEDCLGETLNVRHARRELH